MYFQDHTYPVANGGALSSSLRKQLEAAIVPGTEVWIYAPGKGDWVSATIEDCSLLEDRCLFEVRANEAVGSSFHDGYGLSAHSGFHGIDWFFKQSDTPPPTHPLQSFPDLHRGTWVSWEEDGEQIAGEVVSIDTATQSFEIRYADEEPLQRGIPNRQSFPFHELSECTLWSEDLTAYGIRQQDRFLIEGVAFAPIACSEEAGLLGLRSMSLTSKGQTLVVPLNAIDLENGTFFRETESLDLYARFPALREDGEHKITFDDAGTLRTGKTPFHQSTVTMPAYLEVLIEKSTAELADEGITPFTDFFHRYAVQPGAIQDVA